MRGKSKSCPKILSWKEKAKTRRKKINYLTRHNKDLCAQRDKLKTKFYALRAENRRLEKELAKAKQLAHTAVKHHSYSAETMQLCVQLRNQGGCSYRSVVRLLNILAILLQFELKIPCFSSVRNWEMKLGYQQIQTHTSSADEWVLIIDESISIGSQKMLLLLGLNLSNYKFGQALNLEDVQILDIRLKKSWKAPEIKKVVASVENRGFSFAYGCCDNGNNLRKLLKMKDLVHIEDCGGRFW